MRTDRRETDESRIRIKEQNKTLRRAEELARIYEQRFSSLSEEKSTAAQQAVFVDQPARERPESAQLNGNQREEKYKRFLTPEAHAQHEKRLRQLSLIFLGLILVALLLSAFFGRDISRGLRRLWSPGTEKGSALTGRFPAGQDPVEQGPEGGGPAAQGPAGMSPGEVLPQNSRRGEQGSMASAAQAPGEGVKAGRASAETTLHGDKVGSHPGMIQLDLPFSTEGQNLEQPLKGIKADAFRSNSRIAAAPFSMKEDFEGLERSRDEARIRENLRIMAQKDARAQLILDQWEAFPPTLRFLAGNNPMALGVCVEMAEGKAWPYVQENGPTFELGRKAPLYLQWDRRWAAQPYADGCIANSACAPTALSMVMSAFTGKMVTPSDIVAQVRPEEVSANGTEWSFLDRVGEVYGVSSERLPYSETAVRERLAQGKIVVILVGEGYFTFVGHMLVILDVDEEGFTINDPNSYENSLRKWSFEEIAPVQEIWAFGKKPDA